MKKLLVMMVLSLTTSAFAAHGPAGCGLGSKMFNGKEGLMWNVLAATFNAVGYNQTFAMSSGTSGCEDAKTAQVSSVSFIEGNTVALSNDIARGEGETLNAYLAMINKKEANKQVLQQNFAFIFAKGNTPAKIDSQIKALL